MTYLLLLNSLLNHMVIDELTNQLLPILVINLNQIPTLYEILLLLIVEIQPPRM